MPLEPSTIKLVCFDLGGVMIRICRTWNEGCKAAGVTIKNAVSSEDLIVRRLKAHHLHQIGQLNDTAFFKQLAEATDNIYTPDEARLIHDAWLLGEYPGMNRIAEQLLASPSIQTGVLSNTNHRHWDAMFGPDNTPSAAFPTPGRFQHVHASHLLGLAKPDPAIYRRFEKLTGFSGAQIMFFDDLEDNVQSALAQGWQARLIDHSGDVAAQVRSHLVEASLWQPDVLTDLVS